MKIQLVIKNEYGEFKSRILDVNEDQYQTMIEISKDFYKDSFNMELENNGDQLYVPPDIVKKSILMVKKIEN
jgi:hypothetical protein